MGHYDQYQQIAKIENQGIKCLDNFAFFLSLKAKEKNEHFSDYIEKLFMNKNKKCQNQSYIG